MFCMRTGLLSTRLAELGQGVGGVELPFEVTLQRLNGKAAQIGGAVARPVFCNHGGDGTVEDALGGSQGCRRNRPAGGMAMLGTDQPVGLALKVGRIAPERPSAEGAVCNIRHPAHEANHPQAEVGDGQPDAAGASVVEHGKSEAKDGVLGIVVRESLLENLGEETESGSA